MIIETDEALICSMSGHATGLLVLKKAVQATCCDMRMVMMVINREGTTRCIMCDAKEVERQEQETSDKLERERLLQELPYTLEQELP